MDRTDYKAIAFYLNECLKEQTSDTCVVKSMLKGGFSIEDIVALGYDEDKVVDIIVQIHETELEEVEYLLDNGFTPKQIICLGYSEDLFITK